MRIFRWLLCMAALSGPACAISQVSVPTPVSDLEKPVVVLLHGLARSSRSMAKLEGHLDKQGYQVLNIGYPSTNHKVETLAADYVLPAIKTGLGEYKGSVNFVGHSMGGIIVRHMATLPAEDLGFEFGRVVMLGPPNNGSELVDKLGDWWLFEKINGPAGMQLGTKDADMPKTLGKPAFDVGVIAGDRSMNLILSMLIPGEDDGKVSIESAKLDGMKDFKIMPATHTFMMRKRSVMDEVVYFLAHGSFQLEEGDAAEVSE